MRRVSHSGCARLAFEVAEQWLLQNAALLSRAQVEESKVNTAVQTDSAPRMAFRPPRYGRACIVEVPATSVRVKGMADPVRIEGGGELDLKGIGVGSGCVPALDTYLDGLFPFDDAVQEYLIESYLDAIFAHADSSVRTVQHYGLIDIGSKGFTGSYWFPSAIAVRQAHLRDLESDLPRCDSDDQIYTVWTEMLLRRYGVTSCSWKGFEIRCVDGELGLYNRDRRTDDSPELLRGLVEHWGLELPFAADRINIQMSVADQRTGVRRVVDFGHYSARGTFDRPVLSLVRDQPMGWGGMILPSDSSFARPDPALVPNTPTALDLLGIEYARQPQEDWSRPRPRLLRSVAREVTAGFCSGELDAGSVARIVEAALQELTSIWPKDGST
jgi:hypothetical protein